MTQRDDPTTWWPAPRHFALHDREVHVWRAVLDISVTRLPELMRLLSPDERDRAERYRFSRERERFVVRRGFLRAILGQYLGADPALLRFALTENNKPYLVDDSGAPIGDVTFNVSHSEGVALYAVSSGRAVGVDVERVNSVALDDNVAETFFATSENAALRELPRSLQPLAFFHCWTRKEAFLKATGEGLGVPLDQVEVSLSPHEPAEIRLIDGDAAEAARWSMHQLFPGDGFVGAVTISGSDCYIRCWQCSLDALLARALQRSA